MNYKFETHFLLERKKRMSAFRICLYLIVGYLVAAFFSDTVFMDMSLTNWSSMWTYAWIGLWPLMLFLKFIFWGIIVVLLIGAGFWLKEKFA